MNRAHMIVLHDCSLRKLVLGLPGGLRFLRNFPWGGSGRSEQRCPRRSTGKASLVQRFECYLVDFRSLSVSKIVGRIVETCHLKRDLRRQSCFRVRDEMKD